MAIITTYHKAGEMVEIKNGNKVKYIPCLLFVKMESIRVDGILRTKMSIKGKHNPFPFKEIIITKMGCGVDDWLLKNGYVKIAVNNHE